ncbi:IS6 family transposase, partial [Phormidium tenue FACHB-886]|nr:IS6 family transposase [Phormidium tenue FACHB-886]
MNCPHCSSTHTTRLQRTTDLGYAMYRCKACYRTCNERTGTPFNFIEVPTDIVFQVLLCRFRYKLSFRDIAEFFLLRGFEFTHETVRDWEERFTPIFAQQLKAKRKRKAGKIWFVDETYIRVKGRWCYLYRAIDEDGNLVDVRLSEKRDMAAAKAFFAQAHEIAGQSPQRVVTDGLSSYPRAIDEELG